MSEKTITKDDLVAILNESIQTHAQPLLGDDNEPAVEFPLCDLMIFTGRIADDLLKALTALED